MLHLYQVRDRKWKQAQLQAPISAEKQNEASAMDQRHFAVILALQCVMLHTPSFIKVDVV
jgi:hypothetical protein